MASKAPVIERRRMRVYVAGPISSDVQQGVFRAYTVGRQMFLDGLAPFIPHSDALFWLGEGHWNGYLEYDLEYILVSDAVYRLAGASKGADLEVSRAKALGIPIFYEKPNHHQGGYTAMMRLAKKLGLDGVRK
jgi:hypothetical protein